MLLALGLAVCGGIIHACISHRGPFLKLANKLCDFGEVDYNQEVSVEYISVHVTYQIRFIDSY